MDRYISVDSGKGFTKISVIKNDRIEDMNIESRMDASDMCESPEKETYIVEYEGQVFKIGCGANQQAPYETTKKSTIHKISTLTAIALHCENNDIINIAIGCPLTIYENVQQREDYKDYMLPKGDVKITVKTPKKNIERVFSFGKRLVFPEGSGILYLNMKEFQNRYIGVVDLGSLNMNGSIYNNCMMQHDYSITSADLGANPLINSLAKRLNAAYSINVSPEWVDNMLKDPDKTNRMVRSKNVPDAYEKSPLLIAEHLESHVEKIIEALTKAQWDILNTSLIFVGGTSGLIEEELRKVFKNNGVDEITIPEDPQHANARGWLKALCIACRVKFPG